MAYSMDLRRAVFAAHEESGSSKEVAEQFGCCESWVRRLSQCLRETGTLEPKSTARHTSSRTYDEADDQKIRELMAARPDATLQEVVDALGKPAHPTTAGRALDRLKLPRKKSPRTPPSGTAPTSPRRGPGGSTSSPTSA